MIKKYISLTGLFIIIFLSTALGTDFNGVCVGINDYPGSSNDLAYCVNDAQEIKNGLINYQNWNSSKVTLLTNSNAYEDNIKNKIAAMPRTSGNTDWFSFSGHGDSEELGGNDGLIPANSITARFTQAELKSKFGSTYNQYCCFLDACGTGIFPRDMNKGVISSASKANEYAQESSSLQNGVFSYYLIKCLTTSSAWGSDNRLTAEELHNYAAPRTTNYNSYQHPQISDNYSGSLYLKDLIPLSIYISGPYHLNYHQTGTFTANPSGGTGTYTFYKWWYRNDGILVPMATGNVEADDIIVPLAPPVGEWFHNSYWDNKTSISAGFGFNFSLKCQVTDSGSNTATDIHSVLVGSSLAKYSTNGNTMELQAQIPNEFITYPNYPNPFNPITSIRFGLPESGRAIISVYTITGQKVKTLLDEQLSAGYHQLLWDGTDQNGSKVTSGVYLYHITATSTSSDKVYSKKRKMVLMK